MSPSTAVSAIRDSLRSVGLTRSSIQVYGTRDISSKGNETKRAELSTSGCHVIDTPHDGSKEVADKMLLCDAAMWAADHPPPAKLVFLTSDRTMSYLMSVLRSRGYSIILIYSDSASQRLQNAASVRLHWQRDVLKAMPLPPLPPSAAGSALSPAPPSVESQSSSSSARQTLASSCSSISPVKAAAVAAPSVPPPSAPTSFAVKAAAPPAASRSSSSSMFVPMSNVASPSALPTLQSVVLPSGELSVTGWMPSADWDVWDSFTEPELRAMCEHIKDPSVTRKWTRVDFISLLQKNHRTREFLQRKEQLHAAAITRAQAGGSLLASPARRAYVPPHMRTPLQVRDKDDVLSVAGSEEKEAEARAVGIQELVQVLKEAMRNNPLKREFATASIGDYLGKAYPLLKQQRYADGWGPLWSAAEEAGLIDIEMRMGPTGSKHYFLVPDQSKFSI